MLGGKVIWGIRHAARGNGDLLKDRDRRVVVVLTVLSFMTGMFGTAAGSGATIAQNQSATGTILATREAEAACRPAGIIRTVDLISPSSVSLPEDEYIAIRIGDEPWLIDSAHDDSVCIFGEGLGPKVGA
jgi:hypothetical protein